MQQELPLLEKLIIFDPQVVLNPEDKTSLYFDHFITMGENSESLALVNSRIKLLNQNDLANIIYTSGTTGEPKGVMITHANYIKACYIHDIRLTQLTDKETSMCFLPLTHIFEKAWTYYCLHRGFVVAINRDPNEIRKTLPQVRPTLMSNVPRFWEKVYDGVKERIDTASGVIKWLFDDAVKTGRRHNLEFCMGKRLHGKSDKVFLYHHSIYHMIKRVVGIDRATSSGGAPLSDTINEFMQSIDVHLIYGYGLTELLPPSIASCFRIQGRTVGKVMPDGGEDWRKQRNIG